MKLFIIHRFKDRRQAKTVLKQLEKNTSIKFQPFFLDSFSNKHWKEIAENAIINAEAVIVFNPKSCEESENTKWEIAKAKDANKELVELLNGSDNKTVISKLKALYDLKAEFDNCFSKTNKNVFDLYKMMVDSSEQLIERRQKTSAFFITVIGSLLAIAGLLVKTGTITTETSGILYGFSIVGLLLCYSWRNLLDNYGKLNTAKYKVILQLEKELDVQMFAAEWVALGKGLRPQKYRSFTSTEKNVPLYFGLLIIILTIISVIWQFCC